MRKLLGGVVLVAGVGGLGWFASTNNATRMQESIKAAADAIVFDSLHGMTAAVSGRDITVSGISERDEIDALQQRFDAIAGRRVVNIDAVEILPVVTPFEITGGIDADGPVVAGVIPVERLREELRPVAGDAVDDLQLADGEPDGDWAQAALDTFEALQLLKTGTFRLTDQELVIAGLAATPDDLTRFDEAMAGIPGHYTLITDIEVEDDGAPMHLELSFDGDTLTGTGKVPVDFGEGYDLSSVDLSNVDITRAQIVGDQPEWHVLAAAGAISLRMLSTGTLTLTEDQYRLTGQMGAQHVAMIEGATRQMEHIARSIYPGFDIEVKVTPEDDGQPFSLSATFDGQNLDMSGKVPTDFNFDADRGARAETAQQERFAALYSDRPENVQRAFILDDTGLWPGIGYAGLDALATLENGTLDISDGQITLNGAALVPDTLAATNAALGNFTNAGEITVLDDGTPIALTLRHAPDETTLSGKLPADINVADIAAVLGTDVTDADTTQSVFTSDTDVMAPFNAIADLLPAAENLTLTTGADGSQLKATAAPGVDAGQLASRFASALGDTAQITVTPLASLPDDGATRINRFTGRTENFAAGYWLPTFDFETTVAACAAQTDAILAESRIAFLTGSADLDVQSIQAINAIAGLTRKCAGDADMVLAVSGHTDNTGDAGANLTLSQARADAVRTALLARGVAQNAVSAQGFGDTQPVADNTTENGRAANRRTAFRWVFEE